MTGDKGSERWVMGGGTTALLVVGMAMAVRFWEADNIAWDVFLAIFVVGLSVAAILLQRYFRRHIGEIGEARFDTRNKNHG